MAYKLKNGVFSVRCRYKGCPFHTQIPIEQNLMGMAEQDVELEAKKLIKDMATTKHDAVYGNTHGLHNPDIHRISGSYQPIGPASRTH